MAQEHFKNTTIFIHFYRAPTKEHWSKKKIEVNFFEVKKKRKILVLNGVMVTRFFFVQFSGKKNKLLSGPHKLLLRFFFLKIKVK